MLMALNQNILRIINITAHKVQLLTKGYAFCLPLYIAKKYQEIGNVLKMLIFAIFKIMIDTM